VYGVDDERGGQRVEAAVVGDGASLEAYAREHLAPAQRPKAVHLLAALPRTSTGKVLRGQLRARP